MGEGRPCWRLKRPCLWPSIDRNISIISGVENYLRLLFMMTYYKVIVNTGVCRCVEGSEWLWEVGCAAAMKFNKGAHFKYWWLRMHSSCAISRYMYFYDVGPWCYRNCHLKWFTNPIIWCIFHINIKEEKVLTLHPISKGLGKVSCNSCWGPFFTHSAITDNLLTNGYLLYIKIY